MSVATAAMSASVPLRRFSVAEFHRMIEAGILGEEDRVELLEGWIVEKMVKNPRHDFTIDRAHEVLRDRIPREWRVRVQSAITTADSEPEPDLVVAMGPASRYRDHHPHPSDISVVIEVADTSLSHDRGIKLRVYARAMIPTYWIVNLSQNAVEVYTEPSGPADVPTYLRRQQFGVDESIPLSIAGQRSGSVSVGELLGEP